jgi:hypothetical protein
MKTEIINEVDSQLDTVVLMKPYKPLSRAFSKGFNNDFVK